MTRVSASERMVVVTTLGSDVYVINPDDLSSGWTTISAGKSVFSETSQLIVKYMDDDSLTGHNNKIICITKANKKKRLYHYHA